MKAFGKSTLAFFLDSDEEYKPAPANQLQTRSIPLELGWALFKEGANAFLVVVAVVDLAAQGLEAFVGFGIEGMSVGEDAHFLFQDAVDEG
jgi:hypothetical protein